MVLIGNSLVKLNTSRIPGKEAVIQPNIILDINIFMALIPKMVHFTMHGKAEILGWTVE